jgi:cytochrome c556
MKRLIALPLVAALSLTAHAGIALAESHSAKALSDAISARKAQMQLISYNMGLMGEMAKGNTAFDSATATAAARNLSAVAKLDRSILWLDGSVQGDVPDTRAKAEIWTDAAGFEADATDLETAAYALIAAAGTDLAALQAAMQTAGKTCSACHEAYRGPKN